MSKNIYIFTDASYSPQKELGIGAYYITEDIDLYLQLSIKELKKEIGPALQYLTFVKSQDLKGCTNIEINTIQHALNLVQDSLYTINLYTDCQRARILDSDYVPPNPNPNILKENLLSDSSLKIHKIKGHAKQSHRNNEEKIFDVLDKAARNKLRETVKNLH